MGRRGRPKKAVYSDPDEYLADILLKLFDLSYDAYGNIIYTRNGSALTLEEYALVDWYQNGCPDKGPITKVGQMKREAKIFKTIKSQCHKAGYTDEDLKDLIYDMSNPRQMAVTSKFTNNSVD